MNSNIVHQFQSVHEVKIKNRKRKDEQEKRNNKKKTQTGRQKAEGTTGRIRQNPC